ncbi:ATP-dependent dethiobiotin synthetase BioD [Neorickettsia sennetsu]|uniref:ATP-dependent dethiobiotin synthetase BioD n=1 Tax=Ehrlichia sennetsu (strain ATCC VR-367 / Miyayama) TaxID=222891 RepID=BIOD_EHRS3|nr:dethiobiotin synthase [Neorickettsia sennetsu]Q2GDE9.1 RecName: Full=ATP-dependent dethiobiotin synthetase BioD; AltName: Full=DTB synthetase; Short=DTBS; AltName: Full=Dethiobiotin synthase [Neorickettsia sennetsu str. Miyayama]ABD46510.1 dethiobiotin synthase [Neorickettsia sennetsu str. Miyayama]
MAIFITGTDTNVGKTIISTWICLHLGWGYFKPIQTGGNSDSDFVSSTTGVPAYDSVFSFPDPIAPHVAAKMSGSSIDILKIQLPEYRKSLSNKINSIPTTEHGRSKFISATTQTKYWEKENNKIVIEGAGGVLVPLQENGTKMVDLIQHLNVPVIIVSRSTLGAINHTLLTLEALQAREIKVLGIVINSMCEDFLDYNSKAIAEYGSTEILATFPYLKEVTRDSILSVQMGDSMKALLESTLKCKNSLL